MDSVLNSINMLQDSDEIQISLCVTALFCLSDVHLDMLASTAMIVSNNAILKAEMMQQ